MILGDHRVEVIPDTEFRLDGGAMFGVVPRVLWERVCPPDDKNRIRMNMNCVFIDTGKEKILIETGIGEKWTEKQAGIYGIFRERPFADSLFQITGCRPEDITIVINTHLHFDHCGGNTRQGDRETGDGRQGDKETRRQGDRETRRQGDKEGSTYSEIPHSAFRTPHSIVPQFPNARYLISKSELEHAENPHERDRASYMPENWRPMVETGQLEPMPAIYEPIPGLMLENHAGHNRSMQTWRLNSGGKTLYGFADLIPTTHHLSLPWVMGYDLFPTETVDFKRRILPQAVAENWLCLFYHDLGAPLCKLLEEKGKLKAVEIDI
ncbi:MAG: MBL fold metallo-hydrolase [Acidobacteria bacterium]|nr:MBL fold metallo-hydrolase [Acidobacteriota bacterium]